MKKAFFGIAVAIAALCASAFTTINYKNEGELVGKLDTDLWMLVDPMEQGITWDCFDTGTECIGTLKAGATPDMSGYYADNEVNPIFEHKHFELITK